MFSLNTRLVTINDPIAERDALAEAAACLRAGGLVVFPTETVYGLGGNGLDAEAAGKIYAAKGRPSDNPLILHLATPEEAEAYAYTNELYYRLARAFMPGPLTVVLPKREIVPHSVTGGLETVALRCPAHPVAHALIELAGIPVAAPSANLSGKPSPTCAAHVREDLTGRVDLIIDGGGSDIGLESTIVSISGDTITLLRPGGITYDALCMVAENVTVADAVLHKLAENERPLSPGMKYRHYAPSAPLVLIDGDANETLLFLQKAQSEEKCIILCYSEELDKLEPKTVIDIGSRYDLEEQAKSLFAALRATDALEADIIYGHLPPSDGLGLALYNRMIRAAAHTVKKI